MARHSCECRTTFVRMSLSFIFSPDSRRVFACFLKTVARPSCDMSCECRENFALFICQRGDRFATLAQTSRDRHTTVARNIWRKNSHKILNMFKTFATSSRHMKILTTLVRHSHECRAKISDKIRNTVARNSHASEILALEIHHEDRTTNLML